MGPSATCTHVPLESSKPSHFRLRLAPFPLEGIDDLSPPEPIHTLPSAIAAAMRPLGESAIDNTKGGDIEIPDVGGAEAKDSEQGGGGGQ